MSMPDVIIFVIPKTLSDGSKVFDVKLGEQVWSAVSEMNAGALAETIAEAIDEHTTNTADVVYE